jgi:mutator protein MutT
VQHFEIAVALIWHAGKVLVARRRDDAEHLPGMWEFPGGKCAENESPGDCAVRETREETGVEIEIVSEREKIEHEYSAQGEASARRVTIHPFDATIVSGEPRPIGCAEVFWLAPDELIAEKFPTANAGLIAELKSSASSAPLREIE